MSRFFYSRLAAQNIRKNGKFYIPYLLTVLGTAASFYIMSAICSDPGVSKMPGVAYVTSMMLVGMMVAGAFSAVLLFYTNSFLIKRRQKELGLYNILGMSKGNIARLMCCEAVYVYIAGVGGGILTGMLFHKLIMLIMCKAVRYSVPFGFYISVSGIRTTAMLFGGIILATLLFNLSKVSLAKPIELLHGSNMGEKEPKTKWITAIAGILLLGAGYYIAITVRSAVEALAFYFLAVALVIAGTYCLFVAVSIAVLKLLRRNKRFYYKTRNFIGVSGMLYRMKQNGVGLANICILSTMVMVMVSGTLSLYVGTEETLSNRYPADIVVDMKYYPENGGYVDKDGILQSVTEKLNAVGGEVKDSTVYSYLEFSAGALKGGEFTADLNNKHTSGGPVNFIFLTAKDYAEYADCDMPVLSEDEVLVHTNGVKVSDNLNIEMGDGIPPFNFRVAEHLKDFPPVSDYMVFVSDLVYVVVADDTTVEKLYNAQLERYEDNSSPMRCEALVNLKDPNAVPQDIVSVMHETGWDGTGNWMSLFVESRAAGETDAYSMTGGFLFLGLFLGFLFIMATVLIIYYKQISEGYDDADRYEIMRKVGLSRSDIRRSVNVQILTVFFLPVIVAAVHVAFDFRLVVMLLSMFALKDITLTLCCTVATLLLFIVIYGVVFLITSRSYYKIVSGGK